MSAEGLIFGDGSDCSILDKPGGRTASGVFAVKSQELGILQGLE